MGFAPPLPDYIKFTWGWCLYPDSTIRFGYGWYCDLPQANPQGEQ